MLLILRRAGDAREPEQIGPGWTLPDDAVWIELIDPSREEELAVEAALGVELPTREDMAEIEASSRLYQDKGATVMIALVLCEDNGAPPAIGPITFVLVGERLVTIRYQAPKVFSVFAAQALRQPEQRRSGVAVLMGLLEAIVDNTADLLERIAAEVEAASQTIFSEAKGLGFRAVLNRLARAQSTNAKAAQSLVSLARLTSYAISAPALADDEVRRQLRSLERDEHSLIEHTAHVSGNVTFLLDAALGLINIEQNEITKVFSIYAVVMLPPTLIAGIYGMNFHVLPELSWPLGYPFALLLMVLSAGIPMLWFKRKGWL